MTRSFYLGLFVCAFGALAQAAPAADAPSPRYAVQKIFHIGGPGRWDYATFDTNSHRLYVTRSTHTQAIDISTGKVVADIPGQKRAHGVAIAWSARRGFITDGQGDCILVFDVKTAKVLGKIPAPRDVDGIIYDPGADRVLAACGDSHELLMFAPDTDLAHPVTDTLDLEGAPEFLAADGNGKAFVDINDKNLIAEVDVKTHRVVANWPTASGERPTGLAIDAKHHLLFVGCRNEKMVVMDSRNGHVLAELPIGTGVDACKFDPETGEAFASCGDGTLTVVRRAKADKFDSSSVTTKGGARTMAIDPDTHLIYLPTAEMEPATAGGRPTAKPDTFMIVVVAKKD